ncbi:MAG: molybdopterin-dependent oxidoreductase [Actinobacteria bacterium]|nr:molybdopterin-dependent oxidoreductase [Actinomycetota bacterium]
MSETFADIPMIDARERVTGAIPMTIDQAMPGMAHVKVVRSPVPHGLIRSIETSEAARMPGVRAVLTGASLAELGVDPYYGGLRNDQPVLAIDKVRHEGEAVALVVADTEAQAEEAAGWIDVDFEELPFVTDAREAMTPEAPPIHDEWPDNDCGTWRLRHGDIETGWALADRVYEAEYTSPPASHVPMEPHVALARFEGDVLEVWTAAQAPYMVHTALKKTFGLPDERLRIKTFNLGGGYGAKGGVKIEPLVACAALAAGCPVRLVLTRPEVFNTLGKHAAHIALRTGVKTDGTIVARRVRAVFNAGAYAVSSPLGAGQAMTRASGPYRIPHVWIDSTARYTNTVPTGPFRGAMTSQLCWAYEQQMDDIAHDLGIDPIEIRRRNLLSDGDEFITGEKMHDVHFDELLDDVTEAIWSRGPADPAPAGRARGRGVAVMIKSTLTPSRSEARLRLDDDGMLTAFCATVEMGQGAGTTLMQMTAAYTGVPIERITIPLPDTFQAPFDTTTASSRATFSMGAAIKDAARKLKDELAGLAEEHLTTTAGELRFEGGTVFRAAAPERAVSYADLLREAELPALEVEGVFQSEGGMATLDPETGQGQASVHWHEGAVAVEIEVDLQTGKIEVLNCHGACYAGRVISPTRVRQQNEGNIIFGLGQALFEELVYDSGQLVNPNLSDYMIPSILDIPKRLTSSAVESLEPDPDVHGVGEMTIPCIAPAIGNALFAATGVRIHDLPMTPERVLRALRAREEAS